jgi:hypothetical protein
MKEVFAQRAPHAPAVVRAHAADMCARAFTSYAIVPPAGDPDEVATALAALIARGLEGPVMGRKKR